MVVRKQVGKLEKLCIDASVNLIYQRCKYLADEVIKIGLEIPRGDESDRLSIRNAGIEVFTDLGNGHMLDKDREISSYSSEEIRQLMVNKFVEDIRIYLWSYIPFYLYDEMVSAILNGVNQTVEEMKKNWKLGTNMPIFTQKVYAIVKVTEAIQHKRLQKLKVDTMPKMIRTNVIRNLNKFPKLRVLELENILGISTENPLLDYITSAIRKMPNLVVFSLKYNCNEDILNALMTSKNTLKVLDVEYSRLITDDCVPKILEFTNIEELSMSKTKLSAEAQANVILGLPNLKVLPRGDFLCEALEWIAWEQMNEVKTYHRLNIKNFWSSEVYYFHTLDQMTLVSEMCPHISHMLFMFQDRFTCPLDVLSKFNCLQDLELWGGDFYLDEFEIVLQAVGKTLKRLDLHHFDGMDLKSLSLISLYCANLQYLGFSGCGFKESPIITDEFEAFDRRTEKDIINSMELFLELKTISMRSPCPANILLVLLQKAINIRKLSFGFDCALTDELMDKVLIENRFQYLEEFEVNKTNELSMKTVSSLLVNCDNLRCLMDLSCWTRITEEDFEELKLHMKVNNIEMKLEEELEREISLYEICQSQLKERYQPVAWFDGD